MKRIFVMFLCVVIGLSTFDGTIYASSKKTSVSPKTVKLTKNATCTVKVKSPKGKVQWKVADKKIVKIVKKMGKYQQKIKIKAKKEGTTKIVAKCNGKKYAVKVKVTAKEKEPEVTTTAPEITTAVAEPEVTTTVPESTTAAPEPEPTTRAAEVTTAAPEDITSHENVVDETGEVTLKMVANPRFTKDELSMEIEIENHTNNTVMTDYTFGKLEKYDNGEWIDFYPPYVYISPADIVYAFPQKSSKVKFGGENPENYPWMEISYETKLEEFLQSYTAGRYRYSHNINILNKAQELIEKDVWITTEFEIK